MILNSFRTLAAIMFTDIVGYTALMQEDEKRAKEIRDRHRRVLEKLILHYRGKILQYYGDGTLSIFTSALESVRCAVEIQKEFAEEPKIPLRIGIHLGDVVYEDEGIYGDGVNVASRLEGLSVPGGVLISEKVYDEIANHPDVSAKDLGRFDLKNVRKPVGVYAVSNDGLAVPDPVEMAAKAGKSIRTIAVLPFVNMSPDPENEYFSDGISEEILNSLARIDGLRVTSRTSSFVFKDENRDIREIGKRLGASVVLEGSVRKFGNKVRITAQLINTADGYHVFSETYDRNLDDIFAVQDEISMKIAQKLRQKFAFTDRQAHIVKSPTDNIEAYNLFLKGMFYWNKWRPQNFFKALEFFKKSVEADPEFGAGYARIAGCYTTLGTYGALNPVEAMPLGEQFAQKALDIDDEVADSHVAMGVVKMFYRWDWAASEKHLLRAMELKPSNAETIAIFSLLQSIQGNFDKALEYVEKAYLTDPLSPLINSYVAGANFYAGNYDKAIEYSQKAIDIDPGFRNAFTSIAWIKVLQGNTDEAIEIFETEKQAHCDSEAIEGLGFVYGKMGNREKAKENLEKLREYTSERPESTHYHSYAIIYMGLEEYDKVFEYLEKAY